MASQLAWLDYSEDDQRHAREIIALFSQHESRDELGIGAIRDALSDALFPGTSVLLTRARYLLFVPWLYREGSRRGYSDTRLVDWVERQERQLIEALRKGNATEGLIGRIAGVRVQNLPSTIYWNSLKRFQILRHDGTRAQVAAIAHPPSRAGHEATELVDRPDALWSPTIPPEPPGFFEMEPMTFELSSEEAGWLADRITQAAPASMLAFLVEQQVAPAVGSQFAWEEPGTVGADGEAAHALELARRFALLQHGAALLYNLLLAERAEQLGLAALEGHRELYGTEIEDWVEEIRVEDLDSWELHELWSQVALQGGTVTLRTRAFVEQWLELVTARRGAGLAADRDARAIVESRELSQKGAQSRLHNDRLMRQWGGASGSARLDYRWPVVRRLLRDILRAEE